MSKGEGSRWVTVAGAFLACESRGMWPAEYVLGYVLGYRGWLWNEDNRIVVRDKSWQWDSAVGTNLLRMNSTVLAVTSAERKTIPVDVDSGGPVDGACAQQDCHGHTRQGPIAIIFPWQERQIEVRQPPLCRSDAFLKLNCTLPRLPSRWERIRYQ